MKLQDFKIGALFLCNQHQWLCTDVGTRVITAIKISEAIKHDRSWLNGPPYAVVEFVFDENDQQPCDVLK